MEISIPTKRKLVLVQGTLARNEAPSWKGATQTEVQGLERETGTANAVEAANSTRPLPRFDGRPSVGHEPSHWHTRVPSPRHPESEQGVSQLNRSDRPRRENQDWTIATAARPSSNPSQGQSTKSITASTPFAAHSRRMAWLQEQKYGDHEEKSWDRNNAPRIVISAPLAELRIQTELEDHHEQGEGN
ncbi:hypothetical protein Cgig2_013504 [Carnegiea gigantea]|uniref:Uncharacterized protein n=1 Tax=Carnegiea gigantea TaxID=171969 RepID=A0A9Q1QB65_9CARY|nr:hypothetical protein Cgig2_013504 [Carnegiea gigantea]